ncbi:MAG: hypothetical protein K1X88_32360 [Nannocystaceae bacterium]|nr:hypothetical protein [Nannocystaceae bacterium]
MTSSNRPAEATIALLLLVACGSTAPASGSSSDDGSSGATTHGDASSTTAVGDGSSDGSSGGGTGSTGAGSSDDGTSGGVTPTPDDCITDVSAGHHVFECDGITYDVEVPQACLAAPCGMVVDVHGLTMSAQMQDANTNMRALGQRFGYIVVQPNANPAPPAASWNPAVDDDKIFDFMQRVAAAWDVDADRWHFTGFSQGGYMSWRFACAHADVLASVAPGAACGQDAVYPDCQFTAERAPSEPLDIIYLHGTQDALVGIACAQPRIDAVVEHFGLGAAESVESDDTHRWVRHSSDAMVLEYVEHDYEAASSIIRGHCYPGSSDPGGAPGQLFSFACEGTSAFVWGEVVMQFFIDHPR